MNEKELNKLQKEILKEIKECKNKERIIIGGTGTGKYVEMKMKLISAMQKMQPTDKSLEDLLNEGKSLHEINKIYKNNILESEKYE